LVEVLKGAKGVAFDDPAGGTMMAWLNQSLLARNEFKGVHEMPSRDPLGAVANGEADFALKLADEIDRNPKVADAGPLPPYYGVHIDLDIAISSRAADPKAAQKAIDYLLSPAADTIWASKHLARR